MGKTPQGTSADELREAAREANAAMKDLQATIREAKIAREELIRAADSYSERVIATIEGALLSHRGQVNDVLRQIADDAVAQIQAEIEQRMTVLRDATLGNLRDAATRAPEQFARLKNVLLDAAPPAPAPVASGGLVMLPPGIDMQLNETDIVQGIPVDTTGMVISGGGEWPEPQRNWVKRKCRTCSRSCWLTPERVTAASNGAHTLCVVCMSMIVKAVKQGGGVIVGRKIVADAELLRGIIADMISL